MQILQQRRVNLLASVRKCQRVLCSGQLVEQAKSSDKNAVWEDRRLSAGDRRTLLASSSDSLRPAALERPLPSGANAAGFGSDVVAEALRALSIEYIALNPGASYRGLHDSLVNYLGNERPQMLLCLHEESAVAIAHGYAKVTGRAMAAAVHSNVGLFHATMAIFNAWCDRMPMLVIGATGPVDAVKRRPWIEWIHTAIDQGAIVRGYTKWDDRPASPEAARESLARALRIANTLPKGPTYVVLDAGMQEERLSQPLPPVEMGRLTPPVASGASAQDVASAAAMLDRGRRIAILAGRASRRQDAWAARVTLAEKLGARVVTDLKIGAAFPTDHPLHAGTPVLSVPSEEAQAALTEADVILSLDWVDLAGALRHLAQPLAAKVIHVSLDHAVHNGWSMDYQGLAPIDLYIAADPDAVAIALAAAVAARPQLAAPPPRAVAPRPDQAGPLCVEHLAFALREAVGAGDVSLLHLPLSWNGRWWPFRHPLDFIGGDGGGGVGGGPGISVGAALALKGSGRLPVSVCGDGDFLMGVTALWTAVHYRIPLLLVVANNRSFYNDEVHQERVARMRNRPVENKWIGQRMADPEIDLAALARAQGAVGFGPINGHAELAAAMAEAVAAVEAGAVAVIDVRVEPGYAAPAGLMFKAGG
jgi:thiamine pyrophosphate-dependent acetolactate synthase large subunit-like protein